MKAVIMIGGFGTRLKPYTKTIPKPLLPLTEDKTILEIIIDKLKEHSFNEIFLATNYRSDIFEAYFGKGDKFGVKINYSKEDKPLGTAGPLTLLADKLDDDFLVINGDIVTNLSFSELRKFHLKNNADLTLTTKKIVTPLRYGVIESNNEIVRSIKEKPNIKNEVLAGIYMVNPKILNLIPLDKIYLMTEFINDLLNNKKRVFKYEIKDYWLDIGQIDSYEKAKEDVSKGKIK